MKFLFYLFISSLFIIASLVLLYYYDIVEITPQGKEQIAQFFGNIVNSLREKAIALLEILIEKMKSEE